MPTPQTLVSVVPEDASVGMFFFFTVEASQLDMSTVCDVFRLICGGVRNECF